MRHLILLLTSIISSHTLAIGGGEPVDWNDNVILTHGCTATIVSGVYVITAAHCNKLSSYSTNNSGVVTDAYEYTNFHPEYIPTYTSKDVSISKLKNSINHKYISLFSNLNKSELKYGDIITIDGLGGSNSLSRGTFIFDKASDSLNYKYSIEANSTESYSVAGDSGSAWVHNGTISAIHVGGGSNVDGSYYVHGTDLHYAKDFILENINGWNYPTIATINGQSVIEVQSLHINGATVNAYTSGDAEIIEQSCSGYVESFQRCSYTIESSGSNGKLHLSNNEVVNINPVTNKSSSTDSGSIGWFLFFLFGIALKRKGINK